MGDQEQNRANWLGDHLPYELKMLRHTYAQMLKPQFYLDWNAFYESFAVHARNLANFLTNDDRKNFKACDFVQNFKARKGNLAKITSMLDMQVFHLVKDRPVTNTGKFNTEHAKKVLDWIEDEMTNFLARLSAEDKKLWDESKARSDVQGQTPLSVGPTGVDSTSSFSSSSSSFTQTLLSNKTDTEMESDGRTLTFKFGPKQPTG